MVIIRKALSEKYEGSRRAKIKKMGGKNTKSKLQGF